MPKTSKIKFAIGDARRRVNERTAEAVKKYTRSKINTEPCRSKIKTEPSDTNRYYFGSLNEDKEHRTLFEMQSSCFDARCDNEEYCDAFELEDSFAPK